MTGVFEIRREKSFQSLSWKDKIRVMFFGPKVAFKLLSEQIGYFEDPCIFEGEELVCTNIRHYDESGITHDPDLGDRLATHFEAIDFLSNRALRLALYDALCKAKTGDQIVIDVLVEE